MVDELMDERWGTRSRRAGGGECFLLGARDSLTSLPPSLAGVAAVVPTVLGDPTPPTCTQYNYPLPNRRKYLLVTAQQPEMYLKLKDRGHRGAGEDIEDPKEPRVAGSG